MACSTSIPSRPLMRRSVRTTSAGAALNRRSAASPLSEPSASKPWRCMYSTTAFAISSASSITRTLPLDIALPPLCWPKNRHRRPLAWRARERDLAAVVADDARRHRQPEPGPLAPLLGGEERVEHGQQVLGGNALAR